MKKTEVSKDCTMDIPEFIGVVTLPTLKIDDYINVANIMVAKCIEASISATEAYPSLATDVADVADVADFAGRIELPNEGQIAEYFIDSTAASVRTTVVSLTNMLDALSLTQNATFAHSVSLVVLSKLISKIKDVCLQANDINVLKAQKKSLQSAMCVARKKPNSQAKVAMYERRIAEINEKLGVTGNTSATKYISVLNQIRNMDNVEDIHAAVNAVLT